MTSGLRKGNKNDNNNAPKLLVYFLAVTLCGWSNVRHLSTAVDGLASFGAVSPQPPAGDRDRDRDGAEKMKRFWRYHHTYQYIPPASRYDYVPVPAEECGAGPDYAPWWQLHEGLRSRLWEDKFVYETFFKHHSGFNGTYLELGAYDGSQESNSRFFDLCLGWKGLLIEGNPENYQKTIGNRRHAHKMSLAPSCSADDDTVQFYRYPITNVGLVGHAKTYAGKPTVDVPCGPLSPILQDIFADDRRGRPTLDFFSLDVEGAESLVLSTIDFQAVRIHVLMIEIDNSDCVNDACEVRKQVRAKMAAEGYQRYERLVVASDIYVHPQSPFQIPASLAQPM